MVERRRSAQRHWVFDTIVEAGHISAIDIYDKIRPVHPEISIATVYRNIGILVEEKKIQPIGIFLQKEYYDKRVDTHGHFFCTKCKLVYDIELPDIEKFIPSAVNIADRIESLQLSCTGVCSHCTGK